MWSPLYTYYHIRSDNTYSKSHFTRDIIQTLEDTGVLCKKYFMIYTNASSFPWIEVSIAQTIDGNFSVSEASNYESANLISIVTSKQNDQKVYVDILKKIAAQLNWELVLDEDDDEMDALNEDFDEKEEG
jgi:hypothetical protein